MYTPEQAAELAIAHGAFAAHHDLLYMNTEEVAAMLNAAVADHTALLRQALESLNQLQGLCSEETGFVQQVTIWTPEIITAITKALEQKT